MRLIKFLTVSLFIFALATVQCADNANTIKPSLSDTELAEVLISLSTKLDKLDQSISKLNARLDELEKKIDAQPARPPQAANPQRPVATAQSSEQAQQSVVPTAAYSLSNSGKRHNSSCRFFSSGKPCTAKDGEPCKTCGG